MDLKLVTWETDLTQFLVDAKTDEKAIQMAIESNREYDENWEYDTNDPNDADHLKSVKDKSMYTVDAVDLSVLEELFQRKDILGKYGPGIVFAG